VRPPLFLTRAAAVAWLQQQAVAQARAKYGPQVRTSIGRTADIRVLCNYLGLDQRRVLPEAVRQREASLREPGRGVSA
jgi:hypothetical protein